MVHIWYIMGHGSISQTCLKVLDNFKETTIPPSDQIVEMFSALKHIIGDFLQLLF